jgi:hypothetical protein
VVIVNDDFDDDETIGANPQPAIRADDLDDDLTVAAPQPRGEVAHQAQEAETSRDREPLLTSLPPQATSPTSIWVPDTNLLRSRQSALVVGPSPGGRHLVVVIAVALVVLAAVIGAGTALVIVR